MANAFLARQPIYDRSLEVYGYELLYRAGAHRHALVSNSSAATSQVVLNSLLELGFDSLIGPRYAFINMNRSLFVDRFYTVIPPQGTVLEVLEDVERDEELVGAVAGAADAGYRIALDDFTLQAGKPDPLLEIADIVKVEIPALDESEIREHAVILRESGCELLAEKVEDYETYELCRSAGYDLFQGYFFCRPRLMTLNRSPVNRQTLLQILAKLYEKGVQIEELEESILRDAPLTYKLLRYVNSAIYAPRVPIDSLHHALVFLGLDRVRMCVALLLMSGIDDKPRELVTIAAVRARMCETVGNSVDSALGPSYFLTGLLSVLDAFLDRPLDHLLAELPIHPRIRGALLEGTGKEGGVLAAVQAFERGEWDSCDSRRFDLTQLQDCYLDAVRWSTEFCSVLK